MRVSLAITDDNGAVTRLDIDVDKPKIIGRRAVLNSYGSKKINVIKVVRAYTDMRLVDAKEFVGSPLPNTLPEMSNPEAFVAAVIEVGGRASLIEGREERSQNAMTICDVLIRKGILPGAPEA